jgi:hypothetical protein
MDSVPPTAPASIEREAEFPSGTQVGTYTLVRYIARGGMGAVYEARRADWEARYAVKVLAPGLGPREGELHQYFRHPNVVSILDRGSFVDDRGRTRHCLVMEYLEQARPITDYADDKRLTASQRVAMMATVCRAFEECLHRMGARHYDLKPGNILVDSRGDVHVADMGLSRFAVDLDLEMAGATLAYAAPEQLRLPVADLDERADVYAIGATLCRLLTGSAPHAIPARATPAEAARIKDGPVQAPMERAPAGLRGVIERALRPDRAERYQSARELRVDLESWLRSLDGAGSVLRRLLASKAVGPLLLAPIAATAGMLYAMLPFVPRWETLAIAPAITKFERVKVVAYPDAAGVEALANDLGIAGVGAANRPTWRRLHAALCDRLAGVAEAVAFDWYFPSPSDADAAFSAAIRRAHDRGTAVVVATQRPWVDDEGKPEMSPELWASGVRWGHISLAGSGDAINVPLLIDDGRRAFPLISLSAAAAAKFPRAQADYDILDPTIRVTFWQPAPDRPGGRKETGVRWNLSPATIQPYLAGPAAAAPAELQPGKDQMALQRVQVPGAAEREAGTVSLRTVLTDDAAVRSMMGKAVLVIDPVMDTKVELGDGPGPVAYVLAASMEALLADRGSPVVREKWLLCWCTLCGAIGAWGAMTAVAPRESQGMSATGKRERARTLAISIGLLGIGMAAGVGLIYVATAWAASRGMVIVMPIPLMTSLLAGAILGLMARRVGLASV